MTITFPPFLSNVSPMGWQNLCLYAYNNSIIKAASIVFMMC